MFGKSLMVTPQTGTLQVSNDVSSVEITVTRGTVRVKFAGLLGNTLTFRPVGPDRVTAVVVKDGTRYDLNDLRALVASDLR